MRYFTTADTDLTELDKKVNEKILSGWKPLGGVAATYSGSNTALGFPRIQYVQAMVKE